MRTTVTDLFDIEHPISTSSSHRRDAPAAVSNNIRQLILAGYHDPIDNFFSRYQVPALPPDDGLGTVRGLAGRSREAVPFSAAAGPQFES
ncbi:MAG: hypothetical protein ACYCV7_15460 [Acidimicrobiales bacterium]